MQTPGYGYLAERILLTRKLSFWRVAAAVLALVAIGALGFRLAGSDATHLGPHVARLRIEGVITDDKPMLKLVKELEKSSASAVLLSIDSPGGTTTGAEALFDELRRLAEKKPTIAVVDGVAASGAYIAALAADGIVVRGNSIVGSIGVLMQMPNASKLMETVGVKMEEIKSSPLKAAPNPYEPVTPEARAATAALIGDSYQWFRKLVQERRKLSDAELGVVADGRVFTGRQGVGLRLVDRIGGEREAIAWLETERGVKKDLPVRDWKKPRKIDRLEILGVAAGWLGLEDMANALAPFGNIALGRKLDGLQAVWQGPVID